MCPQNRGSTRYSYIAHFLQHAYKHSRPPPRSHNMPSQARIHLQQALSRLASLAISRSGRHPINAPLAVVAINTRIATVAVPPREHHHQPVLTR
ncbi:hypothetical protein PYCCODRAFT_192164 [Trametes coccinea BRFM310]|uniref:Uncharacterized protein n=1 Tax=Trametes coccinea (strain BRFM310) TaxID=1353009 RepID=A0A1Y2IRG3_TRAC3|nr:hypothetical protein PYCCODRAFT_192164 [Trametes coccinea BRFM310]